MLPGGSGKSKGKCEKFHQVVDSYLREAKAHQLRTLEQLNHYWGIFLEEYYHKKPHEGIREYYESLGSPVPSQGISPLQEWGRDSRPLAFLDTGVVAEAFLHHETRLVDKGACISFQGRKYETKPSLIGCKVEISYDPMSPEVIRVSYPGIPPFDAGPVKIGEFCSKTPALPVSMQEQETEASRFLSALEKKHAKSRQQAADAISFGPVQEGWWQQCMKHFSRWSIRPFSRNTPVAGLYESPAMADTLGRLAYAADRQLFAVVTADAGCGKSTLIRRFVTSLPKEEYLFLYLSDSKTDPAVVL